MWNESKTNWIKGRGRFFNHTYSYERQIDKLLEKWFAYCNQSERTCNYCQKEKWWKDICQKHLNV